MLRICRRVPDDEAVLPAHPSVSLVHSDTHTGTWTSFHGTEERRKLGCFASANIISDAGPGTACAGLEE